MRVPFLLLATVLWGALAAPASAFTLLTLDKEATFYADSSGASGIAEIRRKGPRSCRETGPALPCDLANPDLVLLPEPLRRESGDGAPL